MRPESDWVALEFVGLSLTLRIVCMYNRFRQLLKGSLLGLDDLFLEAVRCGPNQNGLPWHSQAYP